MPERTVPAGQHVSPGDVVWVDLDPTISSEQAGHRPAVVVSAPDYLDAIPNVVIVVPVTTTHRGLPHLIRLGAQCGLPQASFAMTEQPRTIDRRRVTSRAGTVDAASLRQVRQCLRRFLDL